MTDRRTFLKNTGGAVAATAVAASFAIPMLSDLPKASGFAALTGKELTFYFPEGGSPVMLLLEKVDEHKPAVTGVAGVREDPFSLVFKGKAHERMPNREFRVSGEGLKEMDILINNFDFDEKTEEYRYEAVFA